jgi:molybdopterin-containing oxidoreductase family membrane subunit
MVALQHEQRAHLEQTAMRPILRPGEFFWAVVIALSIVVLMALVAYLQQLREGLAVTGLNQRVSWGFYISDMVFFIGISYGGAMTSAILRLTNAPWRAPLSRIAETMAVVAVLVGAVFPLIDMGRPERMGNLFLHGQVGSPVLWDVVAVTTYLVAGVIFLYLPLIPDIAVCRDRLGPAGGKMRARLYELLALGWQNTPEQKRALEWGTTVVAITIIPLAVAVHSVLAFLFGVTSRPGWDSTIFAPYFVLGAMFSGVATVILAVAGFRWAYHLEEYIGRKHFEYLSFIMLTLGVAYGYFMFSEYLTEGYKMHRGVGTMMELLMTGDLAPFFWLFGLGGLILPILLVALPFTRNVSGITVAALAVVLGMWLKRFLIVVPVLAEPLMPSEVVIYWPSRVEIAITAGAAAAIPLLMLLFFRVFPIISVYEIEEAAEAEPRKLESLAEDEGRLP